MLERYQQEISVVLNKFWSTQAPALRQAAGWMAESIAADGLVHIFGSGHSVLPVLDMFPRYGSYAGFNPMMDSRLMWLSVMETGGAKELLWLERTEGYARVFLEDKDLLAGDLMLVFSHGGLNAAPIEVALEAKRRGLKVVAATSMDNHRHRTATHSSGKKLADIADLAIDNCVPAEDALVEVEGMLGRVSAGSTVSFITIGMALVAEVAAQLRQRGITPRQFVSPNVAGFSPDNNRQVFADFHQRRLRHAARRLNQTAHS